MITYKKKSLKVHNIIARHTGSEKDFYSERIADGLEKFIEKGEYSRIVDIFIYGESNQSLVCSIVYEQVPKE